MQQLDLVHGDIWAALRSLVDVCGGSKTVGPLIWPAKPKSDSWLDDCLNPDRQAKLCLEEFFHLLRIGRERGWHHAKHFVDDKTFYERTAPANPTVRKEAAKERFADAVDRLEGIRDEIRECEDMEAAERKVRAIR